MYIYILKYVYTYTYIYLYVHECVHTYKQARDMTHEEALGIAVEGKDELPEHIRVELESTLFHQILLVPPLLLDACPVCSFMLLSKYGCVHTRAPTHTQMGIHRHAHAHTSSRKYPHRYAHLSKHAQTHT